MKYIIYHLWIISLLFPLGMQAKVRLTSIWGDNMVLQQQSEVTFHGKASANSKITIEVTSMEIGIFNFLLRKQAVPILLHSLTARHLY